MKMTQTNHRKQIIIHGSLLKFSGFPISTELEAYEKNSNDSTKIMWNVREFEEGDTIFTCLQLNGLGSRTIETNKVIMAKGSSPKDITFIIEEK